VRGSWTRQETRAAILSYLWRSGGSFRPALTSDVGLTDASISRIVAELRAEGLVDETKKTAPYRGGPSTFLSLSRRHLLGTLELSNGAVNIGVGNLAGDLLFSDRYDLPDGSCAVAVERATGVAIAKLAEWTAERPAGLEQIAVSIPGYHSDQPENPIVALRPSFVEHQLRTHFPGVAVTLANSILARAITHRLRMGVAREGKAYFYVFAGHGVAGAFVDDLAESGDIVPCEIGHMVFDQRGPRCRCGHSGCLEAYISTAVIAPLLDASEAELLALGPRWGERIRLPDSAITDVEARLTQLGLAIGNALNFGRIRRVVIAGWPSGFQEEGRSSILMGINSSLLGGASGIDLSFSAAGFGEEPASGLALAAFSFIRRGGQPRTADDRTPTGPPVAGAA
jgi:predicted NBD/HSP70 family sugar kinase